MKLPEQPEVHVITKEKVSSSNEVKEVTEYLYKVRPSFKETSIETVKIEKTEGVKKITVIEKKDNETIRKVIIKDETTQEMNLVD